MAPTLSQAEIKNRLSHKHIHVKNWSDLTNKLGDMTDTAWIFRGVSSHLYLPIPTIGRIPQYKRAQEERLYRIFKDRIVALGSINTSDDWQILAYAQHVGVPTRLLDWTTNPLIAAFFALCSENDSDRLIYCMKYSTYIHEVDVISTSPFDNKKEGRFSPPLVFDRLRWQRGVFTIHPDPTKVFYRSGMRVIRINSDQVKDFRKRLFKFGIDYWHVFPDIHGLGKQIEWQYKNKVGLGSLFMSKK